MILRQNVKKHGTHGLKQCTFSFLYKITKTVQDAGWAGQKRKGRDYPGKSGTFGIYAIITYWWQWLRSDPVLVTPLFLTIHSSSRDWHVTLAVDLLIILTFFRFSLKVFHHKVCLNCPHLWQFFIKTKNLYDVWKEKLQFNPECG